MSDAKGDVDVAKDLVALREWMTTQPHLPQQLGDKILRRFLHSCYYDLENTKKCVELFFTLRAASPDVFSERDPTGQQMRDMFETMNLAIIRLPDQSNLFICKLKDCSLFSQLGMARLLVSQYDIWMMEEEHLETKDIFVIDVMEASISLIFKLNMSIAKTMGPYLQEAMPLRMKEVHLINVHTFVDKFFNVIKTVIKPSITEQIHFHTPNSDTLYQYIDKDELPADYGGRARSMEAYTKEWAQKMLKHRDFLMDGREWTADESKRIQKAEPAKKEYFF